MSKKYKFIIALVVAAATTAGITTIKTCQITKNKVEVIINSPKTTTPEQQLTEREKKLQEKEKEIEEKEKEIQKKEEINNKFKDGENKSLKPEEGLKNIPKEPSQETSQRSNSLRKNTISAVKKKSSNRRYIFPRRNQTNLPFKYPPNPTEESSKEAIQEPSPERPRNYIPQTPTIISRIETPAIEQETLPEQNQQKKKKGLLRKLATPFVKIGSGVKKITKAIFH